MGKGGEEKGKLVGGDVASMSLGGIDAASSSVHFWCQDV
jgi:hypothetical protein